MTLLVGSSGARRPRTPAAGRSRGLHAARRTRGSLAHPAGEGGGRHLARALAAAAAFTLLTGFGPYRAEGLGANALGVADAVVASGSGTTALYANPAGMSSTRQQVLSGGFVRNPLQGSSALHVASVDSTSDWGLAAGAGYVSDTNWMLDHPQRTGNDLRLGLAAGTASDAGRLQVGVAARRVDINHAGHGITGWTGDAGVAAAFGPLRLGAVYRNAMRVDPIETPRRIATGFGLAGEQILVEVDGSWNVDPGSGPIYRAGAAYQFGVEEGIQVRAGYVWDEGTPTHFAHVVNGGLSYRTPRMSVDLSAGVGLRDPEVIAAIGFVWVMPYDSN